MKFVNLGSTELKVTDFCLGTMTWGEQTDEVDAHKQIEMSLDAGINFIDTAEMYPVCPLRAETTGDTEKILGNWLGKNSQKRKELVIATKISGKGYKNVRNGKGIFPKEIRLAIEGSLKNLQTDYIDLYQLHWPNRGSYHFRQYWNYDPTSQESSVERENIELVVKELYDLKKEGKIRYIGLSNETAWGTVQFANEAKKYKDFSIASIQNEYSLMCRLFDNDFNELSINENIPLLAYSPLARGLLTGKYIDNKIPEGSRLSRDDKIRKIVNENSDLAVKSYCSLASKYHIDPVHMSLAFCNERPFMGSVIFGATDITQLRKILAGINLKLDSEINDEIRILYKKFPLTF